MGGNLPVSQHAAFVIGLAEQIRPRYPQALATAVRLARAIDASPSALRSALLVAAHQHLVRTVLATAARPDRAADEVLTVAFYEVRGLDRIAEAVRVTVAGPGRYRVWRSDGAAGSGRPVTQADVDAWARELTAGAGL